MKNIIKFTILFLAIHLCVSCEEDGTIGLEEYGNLTGKVVTKTNFEPIANAKVTLSPTNNTVFTDEEGNFEFTGVVAQDYSVQANKEGYLDSFEAATVVKDGAISVVIEMDVSTALNQPPSVPELISPADGVSNLENTVQLVWSSSDVDDDELRYTIILQNDFNNEIITLDNQIDTVLTLQSLRFGAKYIWQVIANDGINEEVISGTKSFTIKPDPGNRFFYTKNSNGNNVVYSGNFSEDNGVTDELMLTDSSKNSWRPRKNNTAGLVAFLQTDNNQTHIYTMQPNGDEVQRVTSTIPVASFNLNEVDFAWSADGGRLLYPNFDKLYVINKDGSGLQLLHQNPDGKLITECDWSEDGSKIVIKANNSSGYDGDIYTVDTNGNILSRIVSDAVGALGGLQFSVTGNKILYTYDISEFQSANYRQLNTHIFIYDVLTATTFDASSEKLPGTNDLDPRFSPNEAEIIFVNTSNDGISSKNIYKTTLVTNNITRTQVFPDAFMPDWK